METSEYRGGGTKGKQLHEMCWVSRKIRSICHQTKDVNCTYKIDTSFSGNLLLINFILINS